MSGLFPKPKVLSLGTLAMDIILEAQMLPRDDGFSLIEGEKLVPGGSCSNVSVALQKMGVDVYQTGQIGDDNLYCHHTPGTTLYFCQFRGFGEHP